MSRLVRIVIPQSKKDLRENKEKKKILNVNYNRVLYKRNYLSSRRVSKIPMRDVLEQVSL